MAANFYETNKALSEYLLFHYGKPETRFPKSLTGNFPARCVNENLDLKRLPKNARALDLGCAVGRSAFELARHCAEVIAIDNSGAFIAAANKIRARGSLAFDFAVEGDLTERGLARPPAGIQRRRVSFEEGDAMNVRPDIGSFDVVLLANLIDRLPDPRRCLAQLPGLVKSGGQLIITSPYTWLESYTPRRHWLGGVQRRGRAIRTFDTLREILSPHFKFSRRRDLCFLIREHARKFQLGLSEATVWIRKS
jgi:putative 4-mercaptohistidine N1-methyltranferase